MTDPTVQAEPTAALVAAVEAVLFAAAEPVPPKEIAAAFGETTEEEVAAAIEALRRRYADGPGGLVVEQVAGAFRLATKPEVGGLVRQFFRHRNRTRLSTAALETLAIIAYRQPMTLPEIQAMRGVDPAGAVKNLLEKKMIRILGRKKVVGNPLLYGTTKQFLVHFGLNRLEDLPSLEEFDQFLGALEEGTAPEVPVDDAEETADIRGASSDSEEE
ncbi:MAG TPA: SMC-Scp complex subunit ScpB [Candidatus Polarisedimenticolaceae bacterium]|nr:SMC-Scp complex subunit ScpB [Candidatus Polarisedimenticolaceae bacterium]